MDDSDFDTFIVALKSQNAGDRRVAAARLGAMGDAQAVEPLIAALKDNDSAVRVFAARGLGKLNDPRAVNALIAVLKDNEKRVRIAAKEALESIGGPEAEQVLRTPRPQKVTRYYSSFVKTTGLIGAIVCGLVGVGILLLGFAALNRESFFRSGSWQGWVAIGWLILVSGLTRPVITRMIANRPIVGWIILFAFTAASITAFILIWLYLGASSAVGFVMTLAVLLYLAFYFAK